MHSKTQTATPVLKDAPHVDNWMTNLFPDETAHNGTLSRQEQREFFRLDMKHLPPLDATLISKNGANIDLSVLNLSASGLCGKIAPSVPFFKNQWLTIAFVLPFEEPLLVKTSACLIAIETDGAPSSRVLRLQFSAGLDDWQKELIHVYVLKEQFDLIRSRKGWYSS
jgi:c-di-GMP-binding flagellar brake protein YcgR